LELRLALFDNRHNGIHRTAAIIISGQWMQKTQFRLLTVPHRLTIMNTFIENESKIDDESC
jgi:glucose-6-phosphate isomerase